MAKPKTRTIYDKDGVKIQVDKYNWILILDGANKDPFYFGNIKHLFEYLTQQKLKSKIKENFEDLSRICNDLTKEISKIGEIVKNFSKQIIEH